MDKSSAADAPQNGRSDRERSRGALGQLIRSLRTARGLSQAELAAVSGISVGYVGMLETGRRGSRPKPELVARLADALGARGSDRELLLGGGEGGQSVALPGYEHPPEPEIGTLPGSSGRLPASCGGHLEDGGLTVLEFPDLEEVIGALRMADAVGLAVRAENVGVLGRLPTAPMWRVQLKFRQLECDQDRALETGSEPASSR